MNSASDPKVSSVGVVRFGVFEADLSARDLRKNGVKVRIQDLPFRALTVLVSRAGEVVTREEFRQALWPDNVFVDFDRGISSAVKRLRDALGDSAENPTFVETVERRGYRWIAPTHIPEAAIGVEVATTANAALNPSPPAWRWTFVVALAVPAALFAIWIARSMRQPARVAAKAQPIASSSTSTSSLHNAGLPPAAANREAEDFYLKGRFYWSKRTPENLDKAVDAFTQAIVHDPSYAPAYVGLADCYNLLREYTLMPASEAYPRAFAAAKKAVELDDQSSEAHASLAFVSFYGMWDAATADREFQRSIDLNPNNGLAHHWYATFLACQRRYPQSFAELERARALDPSSSSILADKGIILAVAGRPKEAVALLKQLEENEPGSVSVHRYLKEIYLKDGEYRDYLVESTKEASLMHDSAALTAAGAAEKALATGGGRGMFKALRREQKKRYEQGSLSPYQLAKTCSLMGNKAEAVQYLKAAYDKHSDEVIDMDTDLAFEGLHDDVGFRQLLDKLGLPPLGSH
ncbi:MAG: winged helix-turn-helix domain-containing protein [Candidatus Sulfotelmatobacter sp.]